MPPTASKGVQRRPPASELLSSIGSRYDRGQASRAPSARMGAPPRRHEMRPYRNGRSPATWNELSLRHAIEMQPSFPHASTPACTHVRLSSSRLAKQLWAVDGYQKVPRAPHRDTLRLCSHATADYRYRWLSSGAVGQQYQITLPYPA
jgi:hypothetical protein